MGRGASRAACSSANNDSDARASKQRAKGKQLGSRLNSIGELEANNSNNNNYGSQQEELHCGGEQLALNSPNQTVQPRKTSKPSKSYLEICGHELSAQNCARDASEDQTRAPAKTGSSAPSQVGSDLQFFDDRNLATSLQAVGKERQQNGLAFSTDSAFAIAAVAAAAAAAIEAKFTTAINGEDGRDNCCRCLSGVACCSGSAIQPQSSADNFYSSSWTPTKTDQIVREGCKQQVGARDDDGKSLLTERFVAPSPHCFKRSFPSSNQVAPVLSPFVIRQKGSTSNSSDQLEKREVNCAPSASTLQRQTKQQQQQQSWQGQEKYPSNLTLSGESSTNLQPEDQQDSSCELTKRNLILFDQIAGIWPEELIAKKFDLDSGQCDVRPADRCVEERLNSSEHCFEDERFRENHSNKCNWSHMDWKDVTSKYGKMPPKGGNKFWRAAHKSCLCHLLLSTLDTLFPILTSFKGYSLPGDLINDFVAGFTIAVLHIPQGMAYGMLSGVDPIYGLYVSFIPVLVMALMSKSRHVSYGTFAVISMLLVNSIDSVKFALKEQMLVRNVGKNQYGEPSPAAHSTLSTGANEFGGLVLTNNHQPSDTSRQLLKNLLIPNGLLETPLNQARTNPDGVNSSWQNQIGLSVNTIWPFDSQSDLALPSNIEILTSICIFVGLIQMIMSLMRLGILSLMFSDQLVSSFTTASAVHVVTSQLGGLFDLDLPHVPEGSFKICRTWYAFVFEILAGFNIHTALLSLISIIFLLSIKEILEPKLRARFKSLTCLPSELVLMSILIFSSWYWQFNANYNIRIVGPVPTGLPEPRVPRLDLAPILIQDAVTVALVSFAMNLSLAQVYAKRYRYSMDPNQELFALGTANVVGSFFSCFPCASSLSRSAIQSSLNVKSQLCSLFSCAIVVSIICYFAPILHDLPRSTLSCIIIIALKGILVQVKDLYENWRLSKLDAVVWIVTFMSVIACGITYGLILGIVASLSMIFFR